MTTPNSDPFSVFLAVIATAFYHIDTNVNVAGFLTA